MTKTIVRETVYLRWVHELLFAIYFALLVVTAHEDPSLHWSVKLHTYYASHYRPDLRFLTDNGYRLYVVAFLLIWVSAAVIFLSLRLLARFSLTRVVLRTVAGVVAVAGFPFASLYSGNGRMLFLEVELAIAAVCVVLWAYRRWPVSAPLNVFLLVLHTILWALFGRFPYLLCCLFLWPGWIWSWGSAIRDNVRLVYPLLGFCSTLLWAVYFRQSEAREQPRDPAITG